MRCGTCCYCVKNDGHPYCVMKDLFTTVDLDDLCDEVDIKGKKYWTKENEMSEEKKCNCGLKFVDYQVKAHETADYPDGYISDHMDVDGAPLLNRFDYIYPALGLAEEAGEVAGKFAKSVRDAKGKIDEERKTAIEKELGDVLWFIAELCTVLGVSLEEVAKMNLAKLDSRKRRSVIHGNGDDR